MADRWGARLRIGYSVVLSLEIGEFCTTLKQLNKILVVDFRLARLPVSFFVVLRLGLAPLVLPCNSIYVEVGGISVLGCHGVPSVRSPAGRHEFHAYHRY